ncbi:hypothetical protein F4778DRAFT_784368 [Xylariomycetidae sp. FL2044]|nr:hypothetical protein F4778DRAFT_784368 [Xylariomycetidae sp. FL2044]
MDAKEPRLETRLKEERQPKVGSRAFAEARLAHHKDKMAEAIDARNEALLKLEHHTKEAKLWQQKEWKEKGNVEDEVDALLKEVKEEEPEVCSLTHYVKII